ncbi:MAG: hypothetical protein JKY42_07955 [Flavobacteriales bacterium]|nr:hypothetical protein [Flavobacteriales bacterium]
MTKTTRRKFILGTLSSLGALSLAGCRGKFSFIKAIARKGNKDVVNLTTAPATEDEICVLTTKTTEGPFYLRSPFRQNIKEDTTGKDLELKLQIMSYPNCLPIEGAIVEIWHCDAHGTYSGYPELGHKLWKFVRLIEFGKKKHIEPSNTNAFLRGAQVTNKDGNVQFNTILPGWYDPRMPHVHFKVIINESEAIASELFFEEEYYNKIFTSTEPYLKYGKSPYGNSNDKVIRTYSNGNGLVLQPTENPDGSDTAFVKIGIQTGVNNN